MRNILITIISLICILTISSCGDSKSPNNNKSSVKKPEGQKPKDASGKIKKPEEKKKKVKVEDEEKKRIEEDKKKAEEERRIEEAEEQKRIKENKKKAEEEYKNASEEKKKELRDNFAKKSKEQARNGLIFLAPGYFEIDYQNKINNDTNKEFQIAYKATQEDINKIQNIAISDKNLCNLWFNKKTDDLFEAELFKIREMNTTGQQTRNNIDEILKRMKSQMVRNAYNHHHEEQE